MPFSKVKYDPRREGRHINDQKKWQTEKFKPMKGSDLTKKRKKKTNERKPLFFVFLRFSRFFKIFYNTYKTAKNILKNHIQHKHSFVSFTRHQKQFMVTKPNV